MNTCSDIHITRQRSAILDAQCNDAYSTCIYALILMKIAHSCVEADAEERTLLAFDGWYPKWLYAEEERQRGDELLKKSFYFYFLCIQKLFLLLHTIQIGPLMADGLPWRCFSFFSEPRQWYLLGSQWDSHKPPEFYLKYLKLCSEDEQSFNGDGTTWGKWLMTKFSFWGGVTL